MNEIRLINANALKKYKFKTQIANGVELEYIEVVPVGAIDNAPTVDTYKEKYEELKEAYRLLAEAYEHEVTREEQPQGEWIVTVDKYNVQTCKCSICGRTEVISHYDFDKIPFCHCGAKMKHG